MPDCRITVLKKYYDAELAKEYVRDGDVGPCPAFEVGQTFTMGAAGKNEKPEGFCQEAWDCIGKYAFAFAHGGGAMFQGVWMKDERVMIATCNDGVRPVAFKLERID